jgi:lysozyme family protein
MSDFYVAHKRVQQAEGGYANVKNDKGGPTMWGVSSLIVKRLGLKPRDLDIDVDDWGDYTIIRKLPLATSVKFYKKYFWDPFKYEFVSDQISATKIYDFGVNASPRNAIIVAQRAASLPAEEQDGILGPKSLLAINSMGKTFVDAMCITQKKYYNDLIKRDPSQEIFRKNWEFRASWRG